jgi:CBS domain-containing protein
VNVKDVMTADPLSIEADAPVGTAIAVMAARKIRHLPVVDARGAVVGIVTDRDLRSAALAPALEEYLSESARRRLRSIGVVLEDLTVGQAMTCNPITTRPQASVPEAAALMLEHRVGSLPVVEDGRLVGIVTDRDAVKALARHVPPICRPELLW